MEDRVKRLSEEKFKVTKSKESNLQWTKQTLLRRGNTNGQKIYGKHSELLAII